MKRTELIVSLRQVSSRLADADPFEIIPVLTALLLLLSPPSAWYLHIPLMLLCILAVVYRPWLHSTPFWYLVTTLWGTSIYLHWDSADNHRYLIGYWCLALCCALSVPRNHQAAALAFISRWLIMLCMGWATLWKLISPDYLDGSFFHYTLLIDERFSWLSQVLGHVPAESLEANREMWDLLRRGYLQGIELDSVNFVTSDRIRRLAYLLTWWTVGIEAALAGVFLMPDRPATARWRNLLLLGFGLTTYIVAPVKGFGWVLMLLGMGQCRPDQRRFRLAYLIVFLLIQAYTIPLGGIVQAVHQWSQAS